MKKIGFSVLLSFAVVGACSSDSNKIIVRTLNAQRLASSHYTSDSLGAVMGGLISPNAPLIPLVGAEGKIFYGKTVKNTAIVTHVANKTSFPLAAESVIRFVAQNGDYFRIAANVKSSDGKTGEVEGFVPADTVDDAGMENYSPTPNSAAPEYVISDPVVSAKLPVGTKSRMSAGEFLKTLMQFPAPESLKNPSVQIPPESVTNPGVKVPPETVRTPVSIIPPESIVPEGCKGIDLRMYKMDKSGNPVQSETHVAGGKFFLNEVAEKNTQGIKQVGGGDLRGNSFDPSSHGRAPYIIVAGKASSWRVAVAVTGHACKFDENMGNSCGNDLGTDSGKVHEVYGPMDLDYAKYNEKVFVSGKNPNQRGNGAAIPLLDVTQKNQWYSGKRNIVVQGLDEKGELLGNECAVEIVAVSPLVLDFSGANMLQTVSVSQSGVRFDLDANGTAEKTGWISGNSAALLALDLNGNGRIDNGAELFGNATKLANSTQLPENGFLALSQYDDNHDGVIDSRDAIFSKLALWFDKNANGISDDRELQSLQAKGVRAIGLTYAKVDPQRALQHTSDFAPNDVRYSARFWSASCPSTGCAIHDVFFGTVNLKSVAKR